MTRQPSLVPAAGYLSGHSGLASIKARFPASEIRIRVAIGPLTNVATPSFVPVRYHPFHVRANGESEGVRERESADGAWAMGGTSTPATEPHRLVRWIQHGRTLDA